MVVFERNTNDNLQGSLNMHYSKLFIVTYIARLKRELIGRHSSSGSFDAAS